METNNQVLTEPKITNEYKDTVATLSRMDCSFPGLVGRILNNFKVEAEHISSEVENPVTIEYSRMTSMAWFVTVLLQQKGIMGIVRGDAVDTFKYDGEYFMFVMNPYNGVLDIVPKEDTEVYQEFLDLLIVKHPVPVEKATIDLSAALMNDMLKEDGIIGILEEGDSHRGLNTYDKRYFNNHKTLDNKSCIYVRYDTPEYHKLVESDRFKRLFRTSNNYTTLVNSTISKSNRTFDILLKIKDIPGLHNYSKNDMLVTEYNPSYFGPYLKDDGVSILFAFEDSDEFGLLAKMHVYGEYDTIMALKQLSEEHGNLWEEYNHHFQRAINTVILGEK